MLVAEPQRGPFTFRREHKGTLVGKVQAQLFAFAVLMANAHGAHIGEALTYDGREHGAEVAGEYGIGFKKGNTELRDQVQKTFKEMVADGTAAKISGKYFKGKNIIILK